MKNKLDKIKWLIRTWYKDGAFNEDELEKLVKEIVFVATFKSVEDAWAETPAGKKALEETGLKSVHDVIDTFELPLTNKNQLTI